MKGIWAPAAAMALCAGLATPALAQAVDPRDEIVVLGMRSPLQQPAEGGALGERSILDTPFSITVVDAAAIAERQPLTIQQVFVTDPSVYSFASPGTVNWWGLQIRGLPVRNYYVDGAPLVLYWGGDYPLEAVETVQALKGATGFMYGFGAPGGVISYRTKRATEVALLSTEVGFRGRSVLSGHLDAGGPVGSTGLGYRANLAIEDGEEYNMAEISRGLGSLALDYDITPTLTWRVNVAYEDYDLGSEPFHVYLSGYTGTTLPAVPDNWDYLNVDNSFYRYELWTSATQLDWRISEDWSVNATLGYAHKRHRSNKTFIDLLDQAGDYDGYVYQFSERDIGEFAHAVLNGAFDTGPFRHELVLGVSQQDYIADFGSNYVYSNTFTGNIFQPQPYRTTGPMDFSIEGSPSEERQSAVFVSDTLYLGEHWQAIVGLRHTYYDLEDVDNDPSAPSGYTTTATTPTVALMYKPTAQTTLYASYVESLESGGRVPFGTFPVYANEGELLEATTSKQYEVGAKLDRDGYSLMAAFFRVERVEVIDEDRGGSIYLTQDGLSVYEGFELTGRVQATDDLSLGLGVVHLNAAIEEVSDANAAIRGNRPAETAEWQIVANAEYAVPAVDGLTLHGNVRYYGDAPVSNDNTLIVPSYSLANVGFSYAFEAGGRSARLVGNINNVFDEEYWALQNFGESINGTIALTVDW